MVWLGVWHQWWPTSLRRISISADNPSRHRTHATTISCAKIFLFYFFSLKDHSPSFLSSLWGDCSKKPEFKSFRHAGEVKFLWPPPNDTVWSPYTVHRSLRKINNTCVYLTSGFWLCNFIDHSRPSCNQPKVKLLIEIVQSQKLKREKAGRGRSEKSYTV